MSLEESGNKLLEIIDYQIKNLYDIIIIIIILDRRSTQMRNKIVLAYENDEFSIAINGIIISTDNKIETSFEKFKQVIKNNSSTPGGDWEDIKESINQFALDGVEINDAYKTISFGAVKYFYNTSTVFYMREDQMVSLTGGYALLNFIFRIVSSKQISNCEALLELCAEAIEHKVSYRFEESSIIIASPVFDYGMAEYNFATKKIHKGASSQIGSFDEYKAYVLNLIKI